MASKTNIFDQLDKNKKKKVNVFDTLKPPPPPVSVEPEIQNMNEMDLADLEAGGMTPERLFRDEFDADDEALSIPEEQLSRKELYRIQGEKLKIKQKKDAEKFFNEILPQGLDSAGKHLWENKFSYTLGTLGLSGGPWGAMAGNAIGTAIDTAIKTYDEEDGGLQEGEILLDSSISAIIDSLTIGMTKYAPGIKEAVKNGIRQGIDPKKIIEALRKDVAADFGTKASTIQSQKFSIENTYGSLTIGQAADESLGAFRRVINNVSVEGWASQRVHDDNLRNMLSIGKQALEQIVTIGSRKVTSLSIGKNQAKVLNYAKASLTEAHGKSLKALVKEGRNMYNKISAKPFKNALSKWEKSNVNSVGSSTLNPPAQKILNELKDEYENIVSFQPRHYIEIAQKLNKRISLLKTFGTSSFDPSSARELTTLSKQLRDLAEKELKQIDPETGAKFVKMQKNYATVSENLFPDITSDYLQATGKKGFSQIADIFDSSDKVETILSMKKALRQAYKIMPAQTKKRLPKGAKTYEEALMKVKQRYVERVLPSLQNRVISGAEFQNLAIKLSQADEAQRIKAIMGKDFTPFKKLVNAMAEHAGRPSHEKGLLALRGAEISETVGAVKTGAKSAFSLEEMVRFPPRIIAATGVLLAPKFMANYVTNPKRVNKLLKINQMAKNPYKAPALMKQEMMLLYNEVYKEFDDEEKQELLNWLNNVRKKSLGNI